MRRKATATRPAEKRYSRAILPSAQPPGSAPLPRLVEVGDGERPPLGDLPIHRLDVPGRLGIQVFDPPRGALGVPIHAVPIEREVLDRTERCHPPPVFKDAANLQCPPQQVGVMGSEPGEQGELVSALHHVDRVDLKEAHGAHGPADVPEVRCGRGPRRGETLGGDGGPPNLRLGEAPHWPVNGGRCCDQSPGCRHRSTCPQGNWPPNRRARRHRHVSVCISAPPMHERGR